MKRLVEGDDMLVSKTQHGRDQRHGGQLTKTCLMRRIFNDQAFITAVLALALLLLPRPGIANNLPPTGQVLELPPTAGDWVHDVTVMRDRTAIPLPPNASPEELAVYLTATAGWLEFLYQVDRLDDPFDETLQAARQSAERLSGTIGHRISGRLELLALRRITDQISNTDVDSILVSEEEAKEGRAVINRLRGEADVIAVRAAAQVEVADDPILAARLDFERGLVALVAKSEHSVTALAATGDALSRMEEIGTPTAALALAEPLRTWLLLGADLGQEPELVLPRAVATRNRLRGYGLLETPAGADLDNEIAELAAKRGERDLVLAAVANRQAVYVRLRSLGTSRKSVDWIGNVDALFTVDATTEALELAFELAREDAASRSLDDPVLLLGFEFMLTSGFKAAPPWAKVEYLDRLYNDSTLVGTANPERRDLGSALADAYEEAGRGEAASTLRQELARIVPAEPLEEKIATALAEVTPDEAGLKRLGELRIEPSVFQNPTLELKIVQRQLELVSQLALDSGEYYSFELTLGEFHDIAVSVGRDELTVEAIESFVKAVRARLPRDHKNAASTFDDLAGTLGSWGHGEKADPLVALARDERLLAKLDDVENRWLENSPYGAAMQVGEYLDLLTEARRSGEGPVFARDQLIRARRTLAADSQDVASFYRNFLKAIEQTGDAERSTQLEAKLDPDTLSDAPRDQWCPLLRGLNDPLLATDDCTASAIVTQTACVPATPEAASLRLRAGGKDAALALRKEAFEAGWQEPLEEQMAARLAQATPDEAGRDAISELAKAARARGDITSQIRIAQRSVELSIQNWSSTEDDIWIRSAFKDLAKLTGLAGHDELAIAPLQSLIEVVRAHVPRNHGDAANLFRNLARLIAWNNCKKADELLALANDEDLLEPAAKAENYYKLGDFDHVWMMAGEYVNELRKAGRAPEGPAFAADYLLRALQAPETQSIDIGSFYVQFFEAVENAGDAEHANTLKDKLDPSKLSVMPRDQWCELLRDLQDPLLPIKDCASATVASSTVPASELQDPNFDLRSLLKSEHVELEIISNERPFDSIYRLLKTDHTTALEQLAGVIERRFGREHPLTVPFHVDAARRLQAAGRTADAVAALQPVAASVPSPDWRRLGLTVDIPEDEAYAAGCSGNAVAIVRARCTALEAARKLSAITIARRELDRLKTAKFRNSIEMATGLFDLTEAAHTAKDYEMQQKATLAYIRVSLSNAKNSQNVSEKSFKYIGSELQSLLRFDHECKDEVLLSSWDFIPPDCAEERWKLAKFWPDLFERESHSELNDSLLGAFVSAQEEYVSVAPERAEEVAIEGLQVFERFRIPGPSDVGGELIQRAALAEVGEEAVLTVQRGRDAERRWAETADQLFAARRNNGGDVGALEEQLGALGRELEKVRRSRADLEAQVAVAARLKPLDVPGVQAFLAPDEAIVLYRTSLPRVIAWVIRKDRVVQRRLALKTDDLAAEARDLLTFDPGVAPAVGSPGEVDVGAAHALYQGLIAPLADVLDGATVLNVIPDGPLVGVPFAMLVSEPPPEAVWTSNLPWRPVWLLDRYAFATAPTVRGFLALHRDVQPSHADRAFAGLGAPKLSGTVSPWDQGAALLLANGSDPARLRELSPLPEAEQEVRAAVAHFAEDTRLLLLGPDFTEPRLRSAGLDRYRILLFATHAVPAGTDDAPVLVLTPPETARPEDDGTLSPDEVGGLQFDAELVILSACRTGLIARGEKVGYSDLVSAFFAAGSRSVMATYWPIDSATASRLTLPVMEAVANGGHAAAVRALRQAALAISHDPEQPDLAHPVHWAAFYIVGVAE